MSKSEESKKEKDLNDSELIQSIDRVKFTVKDLLKPKIQFASGNEAIVYGALLSGCKFFAGYPITPASEIMELMSSYLPLLDGVFLEMEDEIASIASIVGASWSNIKTMTATSGPGFSLMQENLSYAIMTETPCVVVNVMRSGPSTGQPTYPAQGDVYQSRWGSHGDHSMIVLAPATVQDCIDVMILAFNFSEKYRVPVVVLSDASIAHMREKISIPEYDEVFRVKRPEVTIKTKLYHPFRTGYSRASKVPEMDQFGKGYRTFITGLTHNDMGFPATTDYKVHKELITRLYEKITTNKKDIQVYEEINTEDAEVVLVSYGISFRSCMAAYELMKNSNIQVGVIKLITLWPFPRDLISQISRRVRLIIVVEMNMGQIAHKVREYSYGNCEVKLVNEIGGHHVEPQDIIREIEGKDFDLTQPM